MGTTPSAEEELSAMPPPPQQQQAENKQEKPQQPSVAARCPFARRVAGREAAARAAQGVANTLYDRTGGAGPITAVVSHFSHELLKNPVVGKNSKNPQLKEWSRKCTAERLPLLIFQRSLWVCEVAGGPHKYVPMRPTPPGGDATHLNLHEGHAGLNITQPEFDEVAKVLAQSFDHFNVPEPIKAEYLKAFYAHAHEVVQGFPQ